MASSVHKIKKSSLVVKLGTAGKMERKPTDMSEFNADGTHLQSSGRRLLGRCG